FICLNGKAKNVRTLSLQSDDRRFADWAKRHRVGGVRSPGQVHRRATARKRRPASPHALCAGARHGGAQAR
ncbi:MAG TPA: hypothetical protein VJY34_13115, partial [Roseiarcus sp.]|nr:hypothetical protein [Roseiarcus sp.]